MLKNDQLGLNKFDYRIIRIKQIIKNQLRKTILLYIKLAFLFGYKDAYRLYTNRNSRMDYLNACYEIIKNKMDYFISNYSYHKIETSNQHPNTIWVCWLQNDNIPVIVQECIKSINKNKPKNLKVVVITANNISQYVKFPDIIYRRIKNGSLSLTHFSDILRFNLLRNYGGLWIDATVFVSDGIPESYINSFIYSIQNENDFSDTNNLYYGAITSFIIGGNRECVLFDFLYNFFIEYQKKYGCLLDIHLINICYRIAIEKFETLKNEITSIGINNRNVEKLVLIINDEYDEKVWKQITNNQIFHKLNWRINYNEKSNNHWTYYHKIKHI